MGNYFEKGNLLYCFSRSGGLEMPDNNTPRLYLNHSFSPAGNKNYIVIQSSANLSTKSPGVECWNKIATLLLENTAMDIIEIGFPKKINIVNDRIIDFTGKKKLTDIAGLVNQCRLFIGIDSGFAHFANALEKNSLIFIGTQGKFQNYMPYSGWMQTRKEDMIIYYPGFLPGMAFEYVAGRIISKLQL
jgi:heptosyltransferase-3